MKKILFMGTPDFSVPVLQALIKSDYDVIGVVTQPDRLVGRKKQLTYSSVKQEAIKHQLPIFQPDRIRHSKELEKLLNMDIDLIVTAAYGQILPEELLNHPTHRAINVHASLLPKYRGAAPIQYALLNGDKQTGITIMYMEKEMDAGDILASRSTEIFPEDNVTSLFDRLSHIGAALLMETLPKIFDQTVVPIKQDDALVTFSPSIQPKDEQIDWHQTAEQVNNHIRAMNEWPGAYTIWKDTRLKIWEARVSTETSDALPGQIVRADKKHLKISCGNQTVLELEKVQLAGKTKQTIEQFLQGIGSKLKEGEIFESKTSNE